MKYCLQGCVFSADEYLLLLRTRYDSVEDLCRRMAWAQQQRSLLPDEQDPVATKLFQEWDSLPLLGVETAGTEPDPLRRRVWFWALRPDRLFPQLNPELIDKVEHVVPRRQWDENGVPSLVNVEQKYYLYRVPADKLGVADGSFHVKALQCWCPTTEKEFWIMCQPHVMTVEEALRDMYGLRSRGDFKAGYRHGDVLLFDSEVGTYGYNEPSPPVYEILIAES